MKWYNDRIFVLIVSNFLFEACGPVAGPTTTEADLTTGEGEITTTQQPSNAETTVSENQGCGLRPINSIDEFCDFRKTLGCPAVPNVPFVPVIQVAMCHASDEENPCDPVPLQQQCPVFGDYKFPSVGFEGNAVLVEVAMSLSVSDIDNDLNIALNWYTQETDFQDNPKQSGSIVLSELCCEQSVKISLVEAKENIQLSLRVDWMIGNNLLTSEQDEPISW